MENEDADSKSKLPVAAADEETIRRLPKANSDKENNLTINGVCVMNSASYAFNKSFDAMSKSPEKTTEEKSSTPTAAADSIL